MFKDKLLQLKLIHIFARAILLMKKLEIEKTKPTFIISVLIVEYYVALISLISSFFTNKTSVANKWMGFSRINLALVTRVNTHDFTVYWNFLTPYGPQGFQKIIRDLFVSAFHNIRLILVAKRQKLCWMVGPLYKLLLEFLQESWVYRTLCKIHQ